MIALPSLICFVRCDTAAMYRSGADMCVYSPMK
jgi:hypothetical protein